MDGKELNKLESAMLNTLIEDSKTRQTVLPKLKPEHFKDQDHNHIYRAIDELSADDLPIDMITVKSWLDKNVGQDNWHIKVATLDNRFLNDKPLHYATLIIESAMRRNIEKRLQNALHKIKDDSNDVFQVIDEVENTIQEQVANTESSGVKSYAELKEQTKSEVVSGESVGIVMTGLKEFDDKTYGFKNGNLIILAARPAMGKSALMNTWAKGIASTGVPVYMFSLEMEATELVDRMVSGEVGIDNGTIINRNLDEYEKKLYLDKIDETQDLPIYVYDKGGITMRELKQKARRAKQTTGIGALFVDYIQLMSGDGNNREQEVGKISRQLKALAKDLEIPVIALAQLSRAVDNREFKLPQLSDLRESGSIEQDADMVCFLWRPSYYGYQSLPFDPLTMKDEDTMVEEHDAYVRIAKNRKGKEATVRHSFQGRFTRFI